MTLEKAIHPFEGAVRKKKTLKHRKMMWECMLGTVIAHCRETGETKYFDYDYEGARKFCGVDRATDLRLDREKWGVYDGPRKGQLVMYGVFPD